MMAAVKERPILFSAPMVRALLDGSKTQTRRVVKQLNPEQGAVTKATNGEYMPACWAYGGPVITCPYGVAGARLWVRETWGVVSNSLDDDGNLTDWTPDRPATAICEMPFGQGYYSGHAIYAADGSYEWGGDDDGSGEPRTAWHPSIHMPRSASRILLEIVSVRVERLNDISTLDAIAEGILRVEDNFGNGKAYCDYRAKNQDDTAEWFNSPIDSYRTLWESINGAGSWSANPWVWVVEFKRVTS